MLTEYLCIRYFVRYLRQVLRNEYCPDYTMQGWQCQ